MLNATHTAGINVVTGNKPNLTDSDGLLITEHYPDAYWTLWPTSSLDFDGSVYNIAYTCTNGMVGLSQPDKIRAIRRTGSAAQYQWELAGTYVPTTGDNQSPTVARNGLTGYSEFGLGYSPIVLPVNLTAFTGLRTTNGNLLRWSSSAEINFSHYGLQQSIDARQWTEIAKMNGRGGNFSQDYSFTHAKATGINHYRLLMVDLDGSARFSHIVTIRGSEPVTGVVTAVYERATGHILLQSNGGVFAQGTQARVTDVHGRMLTQMALPQTNRAVLGTGYLPGGVYLIQLQEANNRQVLKVFAE
jgi:hypothetical protein